MQLSQIPLKLQTPLVAESVGAAKYWLYCLSPLLRAPWLRMDTPLATVEQMTLGTQTRIPFSHMFTGKRFLSDWNEFSFESEPQDSIEEPITTEASTSAPEAVPAPASPITPSAPATKELALAKSSRLEATQLKSRHSRSAKPRNRRANQFDQESRLEQQKQSKSKPIQSTSQIEHLQPQNESQHHEQNSKQAKNSQYAAILKHLEDNPQKQIGFNKSQQFYTINGSEQNIEDASQLEYEVNSIEYSKLPQEKEYIEADIQVLGIPRSKIEQTKESQIQKPEVDKLEHKKQSVEAKKERKSRQNQLSKSLKNYTIENQESADVVVTEYLLDESQIDFESDGLQINPNIENRDIQAEDSALSNLAKASQSKQVKREKLAAKSNSPISKTIDQSLAITSANERLADTALTEQTEQIKNSTPKTDSTLGTSTFPEQLKMSIPPQGFSVGGQVTSSAPTKSIDASDTVPAMLTPGEFIINATNAQKHLPLLHHINQGGRLKMVSDQEQQGSSKANLNHHHHEQICPAQHLTIKPAIRGFHIMPPAPPYLLSQPLLKIDGSPASTELTKDILRIVVEESLHLSAMFTIVLHNNYLPASTDSSNQPWRHRPYLEIGKKVEIGFGNSVTQDPNFREEAKSPLIRGEITAIDVSFTHRSESHLIVRGYDLSHRLHRGRHNRSFQNLTDSDIAKKIA